MAETVVAAEKGNLRLLQAIAAFFIALKLIYIFTVGPIADEAYYWDWGQHPSLSYFDHPPFQAWMLGFSDLVFGRSLIALRWLTLATMAGVFYIFAIWAKRYGGSQWRLYFWRGVVIYLASTTFGFFSSLAMHDYMLVFVCLVSAHFFIEALTQFQERGSLRMRDLYIGAFFLGLCGLTKYNGVFLGVGLFLYILTDRSLRPLFRNPHLWLAALLAVGMQAPVLIWNYFDNFRSFGFHLSDRHPVGWLTRINWLTFGDFLVVSALLVSPFLVPVFARFLLSKPITPPERTAKGLAIRVFWASTACFLVISLFDQVWWWWNLVAYVPMLPFLSQHMGQRFLFYGHVVLGAVLAVFLLVSSAVVPLSPFVGVPDPTRSRLYGWELLAAPIKAAQEQHETQFVAAYTSELAGVAAFALDDRDVTALTPIHNQFDYWFDPEAHAGQNAVAVLQDGDAEAALAVMFERLTLLETVPVERFGRHLNAFRIYYAEGFRPGF